MLLTLYFFALLGVLGGAAVASSLTTLLILALVLILLRDLNYASSRGRRLRVARRVVPRSFLLNDLTSAAILSFLTLIILLLVLVFLPPASAAILSFLALIVLSAA